MTTAKFIKDGNRFEANIQGHANFNPGNDTICASCSTLTYTLLQCMRAERESGAFDEYRDFVDEKDGHCRIKLKAKEETAGYIDVMMSVIASGFALLANKYPKNVKLKYIEMQPEHGISQ